MEAVKSIDELYEEVKGYDLVLCNDAPLATALNNRVNKAMLGHFAVTPRQLAASLCMEVTGKPLIDDIRLVKKVSDDTGYSLRYVHGEIQNFMAAERYTAEPRMGRKAKHVWEAYNGYNTLNRLMRGIDGFIKDYYRKHDLKVAVIGGEMFDQLDRHLLPDNCDNIEIVDERAPDFEIPCLRVLGNDRQIAECAVDLVKMCDSPNDIAIVMDTQGPMADAVKSALYREEIPFINSLNVRDLSNVRNYLEFIQLALSFETVRVRDLRELMSAYGGRIYGKYDRYYLSKFFASGIKRSDETQRILGIMSTVRDRTFGEVCRECVPPAERPSVTMLLDQMECEKSPVSQDILDDLVYAVNSIGSLDHNEQISPDEKTGVLLVDCKNSVFIDRPVVVYTGMCSEWDIDLSKLDYIDPKKLPDIDDDNAHRFRALIQQGSARYYLVNATKGGKDAVPCRYFDANMRLSKYECLIRELTEEEKERTKPITKFEQVSGTLIEGPWPIRKKDRSAYVGEQTVEGQGAPEVFSNSSYVKFLQCPRQYMLYRLANSPDTSTTFTGSRIHEYAEFRASYPEIAKETLRENGPGYYADMIAAECAPLNSPDLERIEHAKIAAAVRSIDLLMDQLGVTPGKLVPRSRDKEEPNMFLVHHGLTDVSEHSEVSLESRADKLHGVIDLLWHGIAIDFKTGRPASMGKLAKKYDILSFRSGKGNKYSDAQALFYIALLEDCDVENRNVFELFYTQELYRQMLSGEEPDLEGCKRFICLEDTYEDVLRDHLPSLLSANDYVEANFSLLPLYNEFASRLGPDPSEWDDQDPYVEECARNHGLFYKSGKNKGLPKTKVVAAAIRKYRTALGRGVVLSERARTGVVLRSTLERFKEGLREDMEKLRTYYNGEFPNVPVIKCNECEFRDMCVQEYEGEVEDARTE